jgi:hypothetical protein
MLAALPLFPLRAVRVNAERYVGIRARNLPTGYIRLPTFEFISHQQLLQLAMEFCTQPSYGNSIKNERV